MTLSDSGPGTGEPGLQATTYNAFVGSLTLIGIDIVAIGSERLQSGTADSIDFDLGADFKIEASEIRYRFTGNATLTSADNTVLGTAHASAVLRIQTNNDPDRQCAAQFGATSAPMMAHPYLREALSTAANRVGFPGVTLPIVVHQPIRLAETEHSSAIETQPRK